MNLQNIKRRKTSRVVHVPLLANRRQPVITDDGFNQEYEDTNDCDSIECYAYSYKFEDLKKDGRGDYSVNEFAFWFDFLFYPKVDDLFFIKVLNRIPKNEDIKTRVNSVYINTRVGYSAIKSREVQFVD